MLYSHTSELAIRAVLYLALQPPGQLSPIHTIAKGTGLSQPYLAKILRRLIQARVVRAFRGPGGGVELGRAPEEISLWQVKEAMEGPLRQERCVLGPHACSPLTPCALHERWSPLRAEVRHLLEETTVAAVVREMDSRKGRGHKSLLHALKSKRTHVPAQ